MSDCFVLYLLLTCMKKKTSGADKFTNNNKVYPWTWNHQFRQRGGENLLSLCIR